MENHPVLGYAEVFTPGDADEAMQTWYSPAALLTSLGESNPAQKLRTLASREFLKPQYAALGAQLRNINVNNQQRVCVNAGGMEVVLTELYKSESALQAERDAQLKLRAVADELCIELPEEPTSASAGGQGAAAGRGRGGAGRGAAGAAGAGRGLLDYRRSKPPVPTPFELHAQSSYIELALYRARKAVFEAYKVSSKAPSLGSVDEGTVMFSNAQFWTVVGKAAPPLPYRVRLRTREVTVPRDYSYLLQEFRVRSGLLAAEDLEEAMALGRTHLEAIFHSKSRKHRGAPFDLGMEALGHGTSQSVINILHQATGMLPGYTTLTETRKNIAKKNTEDFWNHQSELEPGENYVFFGDNYFDQKTCVHAVSWIGA